MPTRTIRVEVTQEDIKNGISGSPCFCPIAIAVKRSVGPDSTLGGRVEIDGHVAMFSGPQMDYVELPLPVECTAFVVAFDARSKVSPFAFDLTLEAE